MYRPQSHRLVTTLRKLFNFHDPPFLICKMAGGGGGGNSNDLILRIETERIIIALRTERGKSLQRTFCVVDTQ